MGVWSGGQQVGEKTENQVEGRLVPPEPSEGEGGKGGGQAGRRLVLPGVSWEAFGRRGRASWSSTDRNSRAGGHARGPSTSDFGIGLFWAWDADIRRGNCSALASFTQVNSRL